MSPTKNLFANNSGVRYTIFMKFAKYFILTALFLFATMAVIPSCRGDDDTEMVTVYTIEGEIVSLDTIGGTIVVKWTQSYPEIATDEITLKVPEDAKIIKGSDTIGVMDINQFDRATIKYRKPESIGLPIVVSMVIMESD